MAETQGGSGKKVVTPSKPKTKPNIHEHGYAPPSPAPQKPSPKKK